MTAIPDRELIAKLVDALRPFGDRDQWRIESPYIDKVDEALALAEAHAKADTLDIKEFLEPAHEHVDCPDCADSPGAGVERRTWYEVEALWGDSWVVPSVENDNEQPQKLTLEQVLEEGRRQHPATRLRIVRVDRTVIEAAEAAKAEHTQTCIEVRLKLRTAVCYCQSDAQPAAAMAEHCACGDGPGVGEPLIDGECVNCRHQREDTAKAPVVDRPDLVGIVRRCAQCEKVHDLGSCPSNPKVAKTEHARSCGWDADKPCTCGAAGGWR